GTVEIDGQVLEMWDRGQAGKAQVITINPEYTKFTAATRRETAIAKALQSNKDKAESGDAYGQFRMGERFRDGEGVPKDEKLAREWFSKAAEQGHADAKKELGKIK
ncbi:MAG: hypothetical protein ABIP71_16345, partial [Verrucomicrobiota bacterium]